jgi:hypothetical protein
MVRTEKTMEDIATSVGSDLDLYVEDLTAEPLPVVLSGDCGACAGTGSTFSSAGGTVASIMCTSSFSCGGLMPV